MILKLNSVGKEVKQLQQLLGINDDGVFGKGTENAVKNFQISVGLKPDGIVGKKTWSALENIDTDESYHRANGLYEKHYLPHGEYSTRKTSKTLLICWYQGSTKTILNAFRLKQMRMFSYRKQQSFMLDRTIPL